MFINRNFSKIIYKNPLIWNLKRNFTLKNVTIVDTVDKAKAIVEKVLKWFICINDIQLQSMKDEIHACDTETTNFDMTKGPLGIKYSIHS